MINTMSKFRKNSHNTLIAVLIEDTKCGPDFIKELVQSGWMHFSAVEPLTEKEAEEFGLSSNYRTYVQ